MTAPTGAASRGNSLQSRDIAALVHPYTNLKTHLTEGPLVMTRGEGVYVYDDAGRQYIEGLAGLWCASLGFHEERLVEAAVRQMRQLPFYHVFASKSHEPGIELAERLLAMAPAPMSKVFFANSGSEANDTAIKLAWYYANARGLPRKKKIVSRMRAYHGVTIASASLTGLPNNHRDFDLPIAGIVHAGCPHYYTQGQPGESEAQYLDRVVAEFEALIEREDPATICAFIAEPVMGAGGVLLPPRGYFERIQPILKRHDILFIVDEVICGFGRTGNMFGSQTYGLKPDMITVAKALSASYMPISALMVSEPVWQAMVEASARIGTFGHGYTYSGHPVPAAVAIETLKIYEERDIVGQVRKVAPRFLRELRACADHPLVGEADGVGLIGAVQLVKSKRDKAFFEPAATMGAHLTRFCQERGLIVRPLFADRVALCPPLIIDEEQIGEMFRRFRAALDDTAAFARDRGLAPAA